MIRTAVSLVCAGVVAALTALSPVTAHATTARGAVVVDGRRSVATPVRAASFNIKNVVFAKNPEAAWLKRRSVIIDQVLAEKVGVMGIQEANPGRYTGIAYPDGPNQYLDLKNGLNKASGGAYRMTSNKSFNCVNPDTWHNCVAKDQGASRSTRIIYDSNLFDVVDKGSVLYRKQIREDRYLVWAILKIKATGKQFLFTTTHLTSGDPDIRQAQWRQMIRLIDKLKGKLPVIATGDFNVQKYNPIAKTMLPAMKEAGYGDVLDQQYGLNPLSPAVRAERLVNGWISSYNHNRLDVADFGFADQRQKIGNNIDWVFASNDLEVKEWEVVVDYDPDTLKVVGTLPSDHNMVRATVLIP